MSRLIEESRVSSPANNPYEHLGKIVKGIYRDENRNIDRKHRNYVKVSKVAGIARQRRIYSLAEVGPALNVNVHDQNVDNLLTGVMERLMSVKDKDGTAVHPPRPLPDAWKERMRVVRGKLLAACWKKVPVDGLVPLTHEGYVATCSGRRHKVYANAAEDLEHRQIESRDARLKFFVKAEKTVMTEGKLAVCRIVNPRGAAYSLELGCYIKPVEKLIYKGIMKLFGGHTVMKGLNPERQGMAARAAWDEFQEPVAVGLDAARFDQHVGVSALEYEHSFYNALYRNDPKLAMLLKWQLRNSGDTVVDGWRVKYQLNGARMSGDQNTGLGNCLLMCTMVWTYLQSIGVRARLLNNGDDCVLLLEKAELYKLDGLTQYFLELGFTMEREDPVYTFEQIVFCQCQPINDGRGWIFVRSPRRAIAKDLTTVTPLLSEGEYNSYRRSVGLGGLALCGGIPIMESFYRMFIRGTGEGDRRKAVVDWFWTDASRGMSPRHTFEITDEARASFYLATGYTCEEQLNIELR